MKKVIVKNPKCATKVTYTKSTNTRNGCVRCGFSWLKDMKSVVKKHNNNKILYVTIPVLKVSRSLASLWAVLKIHSGLCYNIKVSKKFEGIFWCRPVFLAVDPSNPKVQSCNSMIF